MPRARSTKKYQQTTAPSYEEQGSGCLSGFTLVPLAVIFISAVLASLAWKTNPIATNQILETGSTVPMDEPPDSNSTGISPIFRIEVQYWADSIVEWASASSLNPNLVATIMQIESCGDPRAVSSAGAMGLFQVMPFHFTERDNSYDPETNAARGLDYLTRSLSAANGDARLAMAGYNGGIGVINRGEWTWSAQTKRYVQYGAPIYYDAVNGLETSDALNDWYSSYGVGLCRQAHQRLGLP
ncbi:MAG: lytic transglycosylase domain-containing protein [Chloroflexi bacterium]|nr:lytic transglycosylase domain-containing protein [Chloroflexota bacterium]